MAAKSFEEQVEEALEGLPKEQIVAFAWRCAVRALPFLGAKGDFDFWKEEDRQKHLYSVFYAIDIAAAAAADNAHNAAAAAFASDAAYVAYDAASISNTFYASASDAVYASASAADAASAPATRAAYWAASACVIKHFEQIILEDIENIKQSKPQTISIESYGAVWEKFQKALANEGCAYWGRLYQSIFENNFEIDREALERRMNVPKEIKEQGAAAVANYLEQLEKGQNDYLFEAKLLLVGEERAGKTTLAKALSDKDFKINLSEVSTHGIDISFWPISKEKINTPKDFRFNVWDFGGQEIYHATHQFFLTRRSLYLFITEARKDLRYDDFYFWLNIINSLSDDSPVILVQNKTDQDHKSQSIEEYQKIFPQIVYDLQTISCNTEHEDWQAIYAPKLEILKENIYKVLKEKKLKGVGDALPKQWVDVRKEIAALQDQGENYIPASRYYLICERHGLNKEKADFLSDYFHDLGVFLHFRDDILLRNTIYINHEWVTKAIYNVFDYKKVKDKKGKFTDEDLIEIWSEPTFAEKQAELVNLMKNQQFRICYQHKDKSYLAPQLFDNKPLAYEWRTNEDNLIFQYRYAFMPKGILSQLIVTMHKFIYDDTYWLHGVLFEYKDSRAIVQEDRFGKNNLISVRLEGLYKKELLTIIVSNLEEINKSYTNLEIEERFGCNCVDCKDDQSPYLFKGDDIARALKKGKKTLDCRVSFEDVEILSLIGNYIPEDRLKQKIYASEFVSEEKLDLILKDTAELRSGNRILRSGQITIIQALENQYNFLLQLPQNESHIQQIEQTVSHLLQQQSAELMDDIFAFLEVAFQTQQIKELENFAMLENILDDLHKSSKWESKIKLGIPLLNLIGVSIETEATFNLKKFIKEVKDKTAEIAVRNNITFP